MSLLSRKPAKAGAEMGVLAVAIYLVLREKTSPLVRQCTLRLTLWKQQESTLQESELSTTVTPPSPNTVITPLSTFRMADSSIPTPSLESRESIAGSRRPILPWESKEMSVMKSLKKAKPLTQAPFSSNCSPDVPFLRSSRGPSLGLSRLRPQWLKQRQPKGVPELQAEGPSTEPPSSTPIMTT